MPETSGEWREERFYVLRTLDRLERELKEKTEHIAVGADREEKQRKDLNEAHTRIRELQTKARMAWWKTWAPVIGLIVIELLKHFWK